MKESINFGSACSTTEDFWLDGIKKSGAAVEVLYSTLMVMEKPASHAMISNFKDQVVYFSAQLGVVIPEERYTFGYMTVLEGMFAIV